MTSPPITALVRGLAAVRAWQVAARTQGRPMMGDMTLQAADVVTDVLHLTRMRGGNPREALELAAHHLDTESPNH